MSKYMVLVSNIGTVHSGDNEQEAHDYYETYVNYSKSGTGKASYEDVTLIHDGDVIKEHRNELYPVSDWQYEVANGDTKLGYDEWKEHKVEADEDCD